MDLLSAFGQGQCTNLSERENMLVRRYIQITLLIPLFTSMLACSYESRHIQFSLAVRPANEDEAALIRASIRDFANARGFSTFTEARMADFG